MIADSELAREIACRVHEGQVRKDGSPQIDHCKRVAWAVAGHGFKPQIVAWLHDTLEDTPLSYEMIRLLFGTSIAASVASVSRAPNERYGSYIKRLCLLGSDTVLLVKIADLQDNLSDPPGGLRERYEKADAILRREAAGRGLPVAPSVKRA